MFTVYISETKTPPAEGLTCPEKLSWYINKILQPIAQQQRSNLKDTTDFINFIEKNKASVRSDTRFNGRYELINKYTPPLFPKRQLEKALKLILQENPSQFNGQSYLQTHGSAIGTKTAVALVNIFMAEI